MAFRFTPLPLLFLHRDKGFELFERAGRTLNVTQKMGRIGEGLKFYAFLYGEDGMTCGQLGLYHRIAVLKRKGKEVEGSGLARFGTTDLEADFLDPSGTHLTARTLEEDYKLFRSRGLDEAYQVMFSPKLARFGGERTARRESSANFFFLDFQVTRFEEVDVEFLDSRGSEQTMSLKGDHARAVMRAVDFMDGATPLHLSRNLGNARPTAFCEQHLPEFSSRLKEMMEEVAETTSSANFRKIMESEPGYPTFIDNDYEREFDLLLEQAVNEYEFRFEGPSKPAGESSDPRQRTRQSALKTPQK